MSKIEALKIEITESIKKIESFNENNRFEVYSIYSNIYNKYSGLNREDFDSEKDFDNHCERVKSKNYITQIELLNLQDPNSVVDVQSNFAQIRISLFNLFT